MLQRIEIAPPKPQIAPPGGPKAAENPLLLPAHNAQGLPTECPRDDRELDCPFLTVKE
jgi:hypothetical protein